MTKMRMCGKNPQRTWIGCSSGTIDIHEPNRVRCGTCKKWFEDDFRDHENRFAIIRLWAPTVSDVRPPVDKLVKDCTLIEVVHLSGAMGMTAWYGLQAFFDQHHIKARVICESIRVDDRYLVTYWVIIPNNAQAMFFKLNWADQLSEVAGLD